MPSAHRAETTHELPRVERTDIRNAPPIFIRFATVKHGALDGYGAVVPSCCDDPLGDACRVERVVSLSVPSWNEVLGWLKEMDTLRKAAQLTA